MVEPKSAPTPEEKESDDDSRDDSDDGNDSGTHNTGMRADTTTCLYYSSGRRETKIKMHKLLHL